jgi:hypothetical protein
MYPLRTFPSRRSRFGDFVIVAFLVCQALDGVLTYMGIHQFGRSIEANPLIGTVMPIVGDGVAVTAAKLFAASLGVLLHLTGVHRAVALLTAFYVGAAILPWATLLLGH